VGVGAGTVAGQNAANGLGDWHPADSAIALSNPRTRIIQCPHAQARNKKRPARKVPAGRCLTKSDPTWGRDSCLPIRWNQGSIVVSTSLADTNVCTTQSLTARAGQKKGVDILRLALH